MKRLSFLFLCLFAIASCIRNDIPYPTIKAGFSSFESSDGECKINSDEQTVNIALLESADPSEVHVSAFSFNNQLVKCNVDLSKPLDLRTPIKVVLSSYQDYTWTISATQGIERYVSVAGQVGATTIDAANKRVVIYVSKKQSLSNINILGFKLGPADITSYRPDPSTLHNFTSAQQIQVTYRGANEVWTVFVEQVEQSINFPAPDVWTRCAWLKASGTQGQKNGFRYRLSGTEEWTEVPEVQEDGGSFSACLDGLEPLTAYDFVAYSGNEQSTVVSATTESEAQLPNSGFEIFSQCESKNYYSFFDESRGVTKWWDSGNVGSTTIGASYAICMPDTDIYKEGKASAHLKSRYVIIKFAAGNLFLGEFAGLVGTSGGKVNFGRAFTLRPRALSFWVKYNCGSVDCIGSFPDDDPVVKGDPDRGQVFVALGDWDYRKFGGTPEHPVQVNTTDKSTFFKKDSQGVIAYGSWTSNKTVDWTRVRIPLDYVSTSRVPTHIIVSCASSMLGDYFTGSAQSEMWLDDFTLEY